MPTIRCLLPDANYQMPTIGCPQSDAYYQMPTIKSPIGCQLPDASDAYHQKPTIRCLLLNAYFYANYLTEVWLSCSDVIQGLLPKPYFPIWQCCGICVIRIWSLHTYRMLTKCKQDSYFTKWWQPKTRPHVTTDANYICLLSRCLLSDAFLLSDARCLLSDTNYQMPAHCQIPTIRFLVLSDAYYQQKHGLIILSRNMTLTRPPQRSLAVWTMVFFSNECYTSYLNWDIKKILLTMQTWNMNDNY